MKTSFPFKSFLAAAVFIISNTSISAEQFSSGQNSEIEKIIQNYLLENPDVLEKALQNLEEWKVERERLAAIDTIRENSDILFQSNRDMVLGNPEGDVTMVEFFDYNCGYCKRALVDILQLLEQDSNIRLVLKEFPVLGKASLEAAQVSVAAARVDSSKFSVFHQKLLLQQDRANRESALSLAEEVGYDMEVLVGELDNPEIVATIEEAYMIAGKLNLNGTPSFVVGEEVVKGAVPLNTMKEYVELARNRTPSVLE